MDVTLLGSGTPQPDPTRAGQSILVDVGGAKLLFDCGPGATTRAVAAGSPPTEIDIVFLTHHHFDHIADLAFFVLSRWDQGATIAQLQIFGPPGTERICELLFAEGGVYDSDLTSRVLDPVSVALYHSRGGSGPRPWPRPIVHDVAPGVVASSRGWTVRAVPVSHSEYLRCYGYRVDAAGRSVVISGDTVPCDALVELARGADLLIHMAVEDPITGRASATPQGAAEVAAAAGVRHLVLIHLGAAVDRPGFDADLRERLATVYTGPLTLGRDGMHLQVGIDQGARTSAKGTG